MALASFEMRIILKILDENLKPSLNQIIDSFLISYREKNPHKKTNRYSRGMDKLI